ncbi:MAG: hypothetical protein GQ574_19810 [Crocinitomix sp.]|nr:hypothetical protein [Crocinitomix sp.]
MAFEKLYDEFQELKTKYKNLEELFQSKLNQVAPNERIKEVSEEFLDAKQVLELLGVCGKTLWSMEKAGHIVPIRINKRRKKYSKLRIMEFMRKGVET